MHVLRHVKKADVAIFLSALRRLCIESMVTGSYQRKPVDVEAFFAVCDAYAFGNAAVEAKAEFA